jgi:hypothetical protein
MKLGCVILLILLMLGAVYTAGCANAPSNPVATPVPTPAEPVTTATPVQTVATTIAATTATPQVPATTPVSYSTNDINKHFIDIAFGPDYSTISKWDKPSITVAITGAYTDNDVTLLNDLSKTFNASTSTTQLSPEVKKGEKGDIVLNFLPESSMKNINTADGSKTSKNAGGDIIFIYNPSTTLSDETIYINSDLKGDIRTHWVVRSLLYELGFPGETGSYPDSIFYSDADTATSLSKIDQKAVALMYGSKIKTGMTLNDVKQLLLINNQ